MAEPEDKENPSTSSEPEASSDKNAEKAGELLGEAVLLRSQGKRQEAIAKCQESLLTQANSAEAFEILGDLYKESGLTEAAIEAYKRALEIAPGQAKAELKVAHLVLEKSRSDRQREIARKLIEGGKANKRGKQHSPATAGLLSLLMPGLGQAYNHQWPKAAVILLLYLFLVLFAIAKAMQSSVMAGITSGSANLDPFFGIITAFFSTPAVGWTLVLGILDIYSVIDAAVIAIRPETEEAGLF